MAAAPHLVLATATSPPAATKLALLAPTMAPTIVAHLAPATVLVILSLILVQLSMALAPQEAPDSATKPLATETALIPTEELQAVAMKPAEQIPILVALAWVLARPEEQVMAIRAATTAVAATMMILAVVVSSRTPQRPM